MSNKPCGYAILEGIQHEMQNSKDMVIFSQGKSPTAVSPAGKIIDFNKEFGQNRAPDNTAIDEEWYVGAAAGMAMTGVRAIAHTPSMTPARYFDLVFNQICKLRYMTGGQATMPVVLWQDSSGRQPGLAGQHADAGQEALFASLPGLKVVIPSDPYDAKGLMIAAIRDPDPVVFYHYSSINTVQADVPDEAYEVKIGEAKVVQEGSDITIVGFGPAMVDIRKAIPGLKAAGIKAEIIDPRSLKPLPIERIAASVKKTGKLLAVDQGCETLCGVTEIIARCAVLGVGNKYLRLAFPDAPAPGNRGVIEWMTPDAPKIVAAAKKMMSA
jgi:acetoin:2,6-dichlorophenolindophenol oxidoreductase subunit beta